MANKKSKVQDIPLGGDYALDANDKPVKAYEDRSAKGEPRKSVKIKE